MTDDPITSLSDSVASTNEQDGCGCEISVTKKKQKEEKSK